jgi:hypothetical protein
MWIIAYSSTLAPMIDEIIANNSADGPIHIYLDASRGERRRMERKAGRVRLIVTALPLSKS